jgi:hypothetical protein
MALAHLSINGPIVSGGSCRSASHDHDRIAVRTVQPGRDRQLMPEIGATAHHPHVAVRLGLLTAHSAEPSVLPSSSSSIPNPPPPGENPGHPFQQNRQVSFSFRNATRS